MIKEIQMRLRMRSEIIEIWDWLVIDFERLMLSTSEDRLSLQTQPIPIL